MPELHGIERVGRLLLASFDPRGGEFHGVFGHLELVELDEWLVLVADLTVRQELEEDELHKLLKAGCLTKVVLPVDMLVAPREYGVHLLQSQTLELVRLVRGHRRHDDGGRLEQGLEPLKLRVAVDPICEPKFDERLALVDCVQEGL